MPRSPSTEKSLLLLLLWLLLLLLSCSWLLLLLLLPLMPSRTSCSAPPAWERSAQHSTSLRGPRLASNTRLRLTEDEEEVGRGPFEAAEAAAVAEVHFCMPGKRGEKGKLCMRNSEFSQVVTTHVAPDVNCQVFW